jgi:hypothetical protein
MAHDSLSRGARRVRQPCRRRRTRRLWPKIADNAAPARSHSSLESGHHPIFVPCRRDQRTGVGRWGVDLMEAADERVLGAPMRITEKDCYHGSVLSQIVNHRQFTAINADGQPYGFYLVNQDRSLLVKYRQYPRQDGWYSFTFSESEVRALRRKERQSPRRVFVALNCGTEMVCCLSYEELSECTPIVTGAWIAVDVRWGASMRIKGRLGAGDLVRQNSFPEKVLA